jgi:hypothetical protein
MGRNQGIFIGDENPGITEPERLLHVPSARKKNQNKNATVNVPAGRARAEDSSLSSCAMAACGGGSVSAKEGCSTRRRMRTGYVVDGR